MKDDKMIHDLLVYTTDGQELRFLSEKKKLDQLIDSLNTAIKNFESASDTQK